MFRRLLVYDPETGIMTWRISRKRCTKGSLAGGPDMHGYWVICVNYERYMFHNVAWAIETGKWPKETIDHINGIKTDNRLCNLREATYAEQQYNVGLQKNNTTGFKGVSWKKNRQKFVANIRRKHLGLFHTAEEAYAAYCAAANELYGEFANHGLKPAVGHNSKPR